ncbi:Uncharacterized protein FKW44_003939, partial [Caligus rogercresseyi]
VIIKIGETNYTPLKISILENLCCGVLLGQDFLSLHSHVRITFGGMLPALEVAHTDVTSTCALASIGGVPSPRLFSNLLPDCKPIATKSRRHSREDEEFIDTEVKRMLLEDIIEPCRSPWRAQVVVVTNSNKKRLVIDYSQTINKFTLLDAYPLPRINDLISKVAENRVFSTVDLKSAYHQVEILEDERFYTAFEACGKLFQFKRIPFGVTNGVASFQRIIDFIIEKENLKNTFAYIDDVTICGKDLAEHEINLNKFMDAAKKYRLTINENKSKFRLTNIKLLGCEIAHGTLKPDPDRMKSLLDMPLPKDKKSLKRALGMFSHYSKWIPRFSYKIKPFSNISNFPLGSQAEEHFENLKKEISRSTMTVVDLSMPMTVETDASEHAIGATLGQEGRPVAFYSRTLSPSEKRHPSVEKEAYAIVESIRKWRHFLLGRHFTLITDQESVSYVFNQRHTCKIKNDKIMRWRLELSCFSYTIIHRPGKANVVADGLSRVCGSTHSAGQLLQLHKDLCHPGIRRFFHFIKSKNLPFSIDEVRKAIFSCKECRELKPLFFKLSNEPLIKATKPMERLSLDFKGPLPSCSRNKYLLTMVDEYSRFPFAYPCPDVSSQSVIRGLLEVFSIFGLPSLVHTDRGKGFMSKELSEFLHKKGVAISHSTPYNPSGNGQIEKYNGVIWKTVQLALKTNGADISSWESVLHDALHSIRSLLCTSTNETPHERMFRHDRKTTNGVSLPTWLTTPGPVLVKRHVRTSKSDPLVDEAELMEVNPHYAH